MGSFNICSNRLREDNFKIKDVHSSKAAVVFRSGTLVPNTNHLCTVYKRFPKTTGQCTNALHTIAAD